MTTAVLLCAGINGLGALRSLARAGVRAAVVYQVRDNPVHRSRLPASRQLVPREGGDAALLAAIERHGESGAVVIPCSDAFADFLSRHAARLRAAGLKLVLPPDDVTEALNDKAREIELMKAHGVTLPDSLTALPSTAAELIAALPLPIIVKPRSYAFAHLIPGKNVILRSRDDADAFLTAQSGRLSAFVAQEVIEGPDEALWVCNCCFDEGSNLVKAFTFQRIRTSPSHFGVTSFGVGRDNPAIKATCAALGKALGYRGPAMIEFKYHAGRDEYCYIETNPRLGMCNILDTRSGVNNVHAAYLIARGEKVEATPASQVDGVYFINAYSDLYARIEDGEPLPRILASYWACRGAPIAWAVYEPGDIAPFAGSMLNALKDILRGIGRKIRRALGLPAPARAR
jgi:D-aspartate ligase